MNEQVMIYTVKRSAAPNAEKLLSDDEKYFYWNKVKFKFLSTGDFVFVVNRTGNWALFTKLDKTDILTKTQNNKTTFDDRETKYTVNQEWDEFIRLKIIKKLVIPDGWAWTSLGSSENTYLNGGRINLSSSENRLSNISEIRNLTKDDTILEVLENCESNFNGDNTDSTSIESPNKQVSSSINTMNISQELRIAIKTKPFIIFAGLSGTGKSRLARTIAYKTCPPKLEGSTPGNFQLIKVRPNWHDSTEVIGYESRISGSHYVVTEFIRFIVKAWKHPKVPFFLCLDEMNLAPVEQYFAEYLSVFETRQENKDGSITTDAIISSHIFNKKEYKGQLITDLDLEEHNDLIKQFSTKGLTLPANLVVMGTVNMDETTHSFSPKVLDRAMTIEKNDIKLSSGLEGDGNDWSYESTPLKYEQIIGTQIKGSDVYNKFSKCDEVIDFLEAVNNKLSGTPFLATYRVRDEFLIYCYHYSQLNDKPNNWLIQALDGMIHMKILPKIKGEASQTETTLNALKDLTGSKNLDNSYEKIEQMHNKLEQRGYTSYWY